MSRKDECVLKGERKKKAQHNIWMNGVSYINITIYKSFSRSNSHTSCVQTYCFVAPLLPKDNSSWKKKKNFILIYGRKEKRMMITKYI